MLKKILWTLVIALVLIQFIRPAKNIHKVDASNTLAAQVTVPEDIQVILKTACYDCHSDNTAYPWYNYIQPVMWWMTDHVNDGKKHLNFDAFATYSLAKQYHKIEEIKEVIEEDEMPLASYTLIHKDAVLSDIQKQAILKWVATTLDNYKNQYPADSLIRKRK